MEAPQFDEAEQSARNPIIAANFEQIVLRPESTLFATVLEEAARWNINEQWEFVL